jgi:Membrane bound O-acyl transferase family
MLQFPFSYFLLPLSVWLGVLYVSVRAWRSRRWRIGVRAAVVSLFCVMPFFTRGPGPAQLILGLLVGYLGIRMAALAHTPRALASLAGARAGRIALALISFEVLFVPAETAIPSPRKQIAVGCVEMGVCILLLVLGDAWRLWQHALVGRLADDLLVVLEVGVGAAGIHRTLVGVAAWFGRSVKGLQNRPLDAVSLSEFWARRWNRLVERNLDLGFFRPLALAKRPTLGVVLAFVASGVMHVLAVAGAGPLSQIAWPCVSVMLFFLLHGAGVLLEHRLGWHRAVSPGWRCVVARVRTLLVFALLSPLLLDPFAGVTHVHGRPLPPMTLVR